MFAKTRKSNNLKADLIKSVMDNDDFSIGGESDSVSSHNTILCNAQCSDVMDAVSAVEGRPNVIKDKRGLYLISH